MSNRLSMTKRWIAPVAACAVLIGSALAAQELALKTRDHRDLGAAIKAVEEAKDPKQTDKARKTLNDLLTKLGKFTKRPGEPMQVALSLTHDLGKAIYCSEERKMQGFKPGELAAFSFEVPGSEKGEKFGFSAWIPKGYKVGPDQEPWPMLLFVPGTKEGKPYSAQQFLIETWIDGAVREAAILVAVDMPEDTSTWNMLSTEAGDMGGLSYVMRTVGKSRELFYVDYDRFYIGGRELGVQTALQVGRLYPQLFAGVIGQSGDAGDVGVENFRNLPTFFAGGGAACTAFEEANRTAGYSNCTLKADGTDSDAWAWALERKRVSNPVQVTLVPTNNGPFRSYWLDTPRQEMPPGARIDATVDRAANRIVIDAKGVKQVTLYFNDLLLDLDKPVKISRNGVESEEKIGRSIEDAIAFVRRGTTDAGRIYVSAKAFDIPSPKE